MKFKFKYTNQIVGAFLVGAALFLILIISAVAIQNKLFVKTYIFNAKFFDAEGLTSTTVIRFKGFEIGKIKSYRLNEENMIDAEFVIYENYRDKIIENSALNKSKSPLSSSSTIELLQGPDPTKILPEGAFIPSIQVPEGRLLVEQGLVTRTGDVVSSIIANVDRLLDNLNKDGNQDQGALFRALVNLANASEKLDRTLSDIEYLANGLTKDKNYKDGAIFRTINHVADLTEQMKVTLIAINQVVLQSDTLITNYSKPEGLIQKMIDPTQKQIFQPMGKLMDRLDATLLELQELLSYLNQQTPEFSVVISEGKSTLRVAQKTLEGINNNPLIKGGISKEKSGQPVNIPSRPKLER